MINKKTKKIISILLSFALLLGVGVTSLWAAAGDVIDPNKDVTLTVQKYLTTVQPDGTIPADGITDPGLSNSELKVGKGVTFKLTKLKDVGPGTSVTSYTADSGFTPLMGVTNGEGRIVWNKDDGLKQGYYLLEETDSPYNGTISSNNPTGIFAATSAPSIITLPFGVQTNGTTSYNYDVTVFPKNVGDVNKKTVLNGDNVYKPGDPVEWDIQTFINSQLVTKYEIRDQLDERLDYTSVSVYLNVQGKTFDVNDPSTYVVMEAGTDYSVTPSSPTTDGPLVTVLLTTAGLEKAKDNKVSTAHTIVKTKVNSKVLQVSQDGAIVNNAEVTFNNGTGTDETMDIATSAEVTLTSIEITVIDKDGTPIIKQADGMSITVGSANGAQFKVAMTKNDAIAGKFLQKDGTVAVNGINDFVLTTDHQGKAYASGIPYTETTVTGGKLEKINLYLVETRAPQGYELNVVQGLLGLQPAVIEFELKLANAPRTITDPTNPLKTITYYEFSDAQSVTNYKSGDPDGGGHFNLPITGGVGTIMFTVGGLALILLAVIIFMKTRKKSGA